MHKVKYKDSQRTGVSTFANRTSPSTDQSLQKSFHLSHADKIELKKISSPSENKKRNAQPNPTMTLKLNTDNGLQARTKRTTGYNKVLPKAGLNGFDWTFVQGSTFVLRLNFCASISPSSAIPKTLSLSVKNNDSEQNERQKQNANRTFRHICLPQLTGDRFAIKRA